MMSNMKYNDSTVVTPPKEMKYIATGFTPCEAITDEDRRVESSDVSFQLEKDFSSVIEAITDIRAKFFTLSSYKEELGFSIKSAGVSKVLEIMQNGSRKIYRLNRNQSYSSYCASREKTQSIYSENTARANQLPHHILHDILKRHKPGTIQYNLGKNSGQKRTRDEEVPVDTVSEIIIQLPPKQAQVHYEGNDNRP
jgi:hypothetical protein